MGQIGALAAIEGAKLVTGAIQAKKASSAVNQAAQAQRQAEMEGQKRMQEAFQQQQQAVSPYMYGGPVTQQLSQYAWNPQTRRPGMGMTMSGLFPGMGQPPQPPPPPNYNGAGMGATADPTKMQMSDMADMGMSPMGANQQSMFMRDPRTLMVREVPWTDVSRLRAEGWTPVQSGGR